MCTVDTPRPEGMVLLPTQVNHLKLFTTGSRPLCWDLLVLPVFRVTRVEPPVFDIVEVLWSVISSGVDDSLLIIEYAALNTRHNTKY